MKTVYVLMDSYVDCNESVHGVYTERADAEADFYDFCYDEVYAVMMTSSPGDVFGKPRWDWEADFNYLMRDCAMTLAIVEVSLYE